MAAYQAEEDATTISEDTTNQQDATTTASSSTPEPETFTTLTAWGYNGHGQLGNGTTTNHSSTPVQVSDLVGVRDTAAGHSYSLALRDDGTVWAWGSNRLGQLGDGTITPSSTPVEVGNLDGVRDIAGGSLHSLALRNDGTVWAWGQNRSGQLGNDTTTPSSTPVEVKDPNDPSGYLSGVHTIAAGHSHSLALKDDGTVWAWGDNRLG